MNLNKMIEAEIANGYGDANAQSKVCQDIILKAISNSTLSRNMTIKGGVVMRSKTGSIRRATQDLDIGASVLINSNEQMFTEKLKSLLRFGPISTRYKDIYDMYYLGQKVDKNKLIECIDSFIFKDTSMRENSIEDIVKRLELSFANKTYILYVIVNCPNYRNRIYS